MVQKYRADADHASQLHQLDAGLLHRLLPVLRHRNVQYRMPESGADLGASEDPGQRRARMAVHAPVEYVEGTWLGFHHIPGRHRRHRPGDVRSGPGGRRRTDATDQKYHDPGASAYLFCHGDAVGGQFPVQRHGPVFCIHERF